MIRRAFVLLIALFLLAVPPGRPAQAQSTCNLSFTGSERKEAKLRPPGLPYPLWNTGQPISLSEWFQLTSHLESILTPKPGENTPPISGIETFQVTIRCYLLAVKHETDDNDLHCQVGGTAQWNTDQAIVEVPPGSAYCPASTTVINLMNVDRLAGRGGGSLSAGYFFLRPPLVDVTGYVLRDLPHSRGIGGAAIHDLWEVHPVIAVRPAVLADQVAVFRPTTAQWLLSNGNGEKVIQFGSVGDLPVPADYLAVGHPQIAVYHLPTQEWFVRDDAGVKVPLGRFGQPGDLPVPADYQGVGHVQRAVFRPSTGQWFIDGRATPIQLGGSADTPVPGDYLGLFHAQVATYHSGLWYIEGLSAPLAFGAPGDLPVPGDYLGEGHIQIAIYRPAGRAWLVHNEGGPILDPISFGGAGDLPEALEYQGFGPTRFAVYHPADRPGAGAWLIAGLTAPIVLGDPGDVPVSAMFALH